MRTQLYPKVGHPHGAREPSLHTHFQLRQQVVPILRDIREINVTRTNSYKGIFNFEGPENWMYFFSNYPPVNLISQGFRFELV